MFGISFKRFGVIPLNLQMFADGDGTGGSGSGAAGGGDAGGADGGKGSDTGGKDESGKDSVTMTQAELDKIINDRVKRAEDKARKAAADEAEEKRKAESMTELEKEKVAREKAENDGKAAIATANGILVTAEAKVQAATLGVKADKISHVLKLADLSEVEVKDGVADTAAVKAAIDAVLKDVPEFIAQAGTGRGGSDFGGQGQGKQNAGGLAGAISNYYNKR